MRSTSPTGSTQRIKSLPPKKRLIKLIGRVTFQSMVVTSKLLRPWAVEMWGNILGSAFYSASRRYRSVAITNLTAVYGQEKSPEEIRKIAKQVFKNFSREAFEFFYLLSQSPQQIGDSVDAVDFEHIQAALDKGKGCVIITAHYGNWEVFARKLALFGFPVNVIARDSDDPGMTGITTRIRESSGYRVFDRDQPIIGAFRALKNNECLGILPDQHDCDGQMIDFFGMPARTAVGPAVLALKSGASVVPAFAYRVKGGRYLAMAYPPIEFSPSGDEQKDVHDLMTLINKALEEEIRRHPENWLWLHDRWKLPRARG